MAKTVWKAQLAFPVDEQRVEFPAGAELLAIQWQGDDLCVWALVTPENKPTRYLVRIARTGHQLVNDPGAYLGTFQMAGGSLIFHAFWKRED